MDDSIIKLDDVTIAISQEALRGLLTSGIPEWLLDPQSTVRQEHWKLFAIFKQLVQTGLPLFFKLQGQEMPKIPRDVDAVSFGVKFMMEFTARAIAGRTVEFIGEKGVDENDKTVYRLIELAPVSEGSEEEATATY